METHAPRVRCMKRKSDVCAMCDQLRDRVSHAHTEEETQKAMRDLTEHIEQAQMERGYYRSSLAAAKDSLATTEGTTHVTFDYAQQLKLSCHTREVGPLYFKVAFRVQLFGIAQEAKKEQRNYLFGEHQCIGLDGTKSHGPNSVLSMLHHYLSSADMKPSLSRHADNCTGQNKKQECAGLPDVAVPDWSQQ